MQRKSAESKISRTGSKNEQVTTAMRQLERKLLRRQLNDRFAFRFNPASPKKLISFKVNF